MLPKNFPARRLLRQMKAQDRAWEEGELDAARRVRTKIRRTSRKTKTNG